MFDIVYNMFFEFIDMLKWYIPVLLMFGCIAEIIKAAKV